MRVLDVLVSKRRWVDKKANLPLAVRGELAGVGTARQRAPPFNDAKSIESLGSSDPNPHRLRDLLGDSTKRARILGLPVGDAPLSAVRALEAGDVFAGFYARVFWRTGRAPPDSYPRYVLTVCRDHGLSIKPFIERACAVRTFFEP
jgi:hypothetical protein